MVSSNFVNVQSIKLSKIDSIRYSRLLTSIDHLQDEVERSNLTNSQSISVIECLKRLKIVIENLVIQDEEPQQIWDGVGRLLADVKQLIESDENCIKKSPIVLNRSQFSVVSPTVSSTASLRPNLSIGSNVSPSLGATSLSEIASPKITQNLSKNDENSGSEFEDDETSYLNGNENTNGNGNYGKYGNLRLYGV